MVGKKLNSHDAVSLEYVTNLIEDYKKNIDTKDINYRHPWWLDQLALTIMEKKYLHPGESTPEEFIFRVSSIFTSPLDKQVAQLLVEGKFFPGGRTLYGAGSKGKFNATMSNCYIMPSPKDSLDGIYESNRKIAKVFKSGGGIGIDISTLRPEGSKTNNAARTSTGAVSFMHLYNMTGSIIGFHGRRGATLIGLKVSHPDIEKFVNLRETADMQAMNISCIIDDEFMDAVIHDTDYELRFDVPETQESIRKTIKAKELYHRICEMNWDWGDPGMLFKTRVDTHHFQQYNSKFKIDISNPCAEYTGPAYNSCNLGSMNLYKYIVKPFTKGSYFDYDAFSRDVKIATEALDQILDYGYDMQPLEENKKIITAWRSIGLGFFGFADALVALRIKYGSPESIDFAKKVCNTLTCSSLAESSILGQRYGSFAKFDSQALLKSDLLREISYSKIGRKAVEIIQDTGALRNAQLISIAPTGSLSLLAGMMSSGIEPIFKAIYERTTHGLEDRQIHFQVADRAVSDLLEINHINSEFLTPEQIKKMLPDYVVEASDIDPLDRVAVQAAMQSQIDNAISSTVNLPESATVQDIESIYMTAYKSGLKGITVFRDNCKRASILGFSNTKKEEHESKDKCNCKCNGCNHDAEHKKIQMDTLLPESRKDKGALAGRTYRKRTACVKALYVTVNRDEDNNLFEVFTNKSVHGCSANIATITRMTSLALRSGVAVDTVVKELKENACQACQEIIRKHPEYDCSLSCPYAIGECIEEEYKLIKQQSSIQQEFKSNKAPGFYPANHEEHKNDKTRALLLTCPECEKSTLIVEGKCMTCKSCGYSKCD